MCLPVVHAAGVLANYKAGLSLERLHKLLCTFCVNPKFTRCAAAYCVHSVACNLNSLVHDGAVPHHAACLLLVASRVVHVCTPHCQRLYPLMMHVFCVSCPPCRPVDQLSSYLTVLCTQDKVTNTNGLYTKFAATS